MTKQQKVNRLEKSGSKVQFLMNGSGVVFKGQKYGSVNELHKSKFGY